MMRNGGGRHPPPIFLFFASWISHLDPLLPLISCPLLPMRASTPASATALSRTAGSDLAASTAPTGTLSLSGGAALLAASPTLASLYGGDSLLLGSSGTASLRGASVSLEAE